MSIVRNIHFCSLSTADQLKEHGARIQASAYIYQEEKTLVGGSRRISAEIVT